MLCPGCGSYIEEGEPYCDECGYDGGYSTASEEPDEPETIDRQEYFYRQAKTASIKGDHSAAIGFYNEAFKSRFLDVGKWETLSAIAGEYEAMVDYDSARKYWNKCREIESDYRYPAPMHITERANFLYRIGSYGEAIDAYEKAFETVKNLRESEIGLDKVKVCAIIIHFLGDSYDRLGKSFPKAEYQNELKHTIDRYMQTRKFEGVESKAYYLSKIAWDLFEDYDLIDETLIIMDYAIEIHPDCPAGYYYMKAIILNYDYQYDEALKYYDKALSKDPSNKTYLKNKADNIKSKLKSKVFLHQIEPNDLDLIDETIKMLPENCDNGPYFQLKGDILDQLGDPVKASIARALGAKRYDEVDKAENQLKKLKPSLTYINITGIHNYRGFEPFKEGTIVDLIREPDNPHDRYAIRVEIKGETVGYVANSQYTQIREVKRAIEIKDTNSRYAEVMFILLKEWVIAKLI